MRIIISPAKKMRIDDYDLEPRSIPEFIDSTEVILDYLKNQNYDKLKSIWKCSDKIARLNYERILDMDLSKGLTPAIFAFDGIQYQYMSPNVLDIGAFEYLESHLRILSGFYGILRPFDGVVPYRLEMQSKLSGEKLNSLYDYWGDKIAKKIFSESNTIINLASKEYSKCISKFLTTDIRLITCIFGEVIDGKVIEKGTLAKMARGEMVRYMAENKVDNVEKLKNFKGLSYEYNDQLSNSNSFVFIKKNI